MTFNTREIAQARITHAMFVETKPLLKSTQLFYTLVSPLSLFSILFQFFLVVYKNRSCFLLTMVFIALYRQYPKIGISKNGNSVFFFGQRHALSTIFVVTYRVTKF